MSDAKKQVGRLAMRREGNFWVAYYAMPDTMEGAILLGSIAIAAVPPQSERKQAFMDMMKEIVGEFLADRTGGTVSWTEERRAPEHERGGRA